MTTLAITHEDTLGYGTQLAVGINSSFWVSCDGTQLHLWQGHQLQKSINLEGHITSTVRISADNRYVYLAPLCYDLEADNFVDLPSVSSAFTAGLPPAGQSADFVLRAAMWSPDYQHLLLSVEYQPSRRRNGTPSHDVPRNRLLLVNRKRELEQLLWQDSTADEYNTLAYSERFIAAAGMPIRIYAAGDFTPVATLEMHTTTLRALTFNADNTLMASAGWDGQVILWQTTSWQTMAQWQAHEEFAAAVAFSPRDWLLTGGGDAHLKIWSIAAQPRLLASLHVGSPIEAIAIAPDDATCIVAVEDGRLLHCTLLE